MSVPNQRIVQIAPRKKRNSENLYAMINLHALQTAMTELNGSSLKLWLYFNKNQDSYRLELSQKECLKWGIKKDSYYSAVRNLGLRGYLCPVKDGSNIYNFYEEAQPSKIPKQAGNPTSGIQNSLSEKQIPAPEIQKKHSEIPERNNTYSTEIIQNNTIGKEIDSISFPPKRKPVTEDEIQMYHSLDAIMEHDYLYTQEEMDELGDLLDNGYFWNNPAARIGKMTASERQMLKTLFEKYCGENEQ